MFKDLLLIKQVDIEELYTVRKMLEISTSELPLPILYKPNFLKGIFCFSNNDYAPLETDLIGWLVRGGIHKVIIGATKGYEVKKAP